MIEDILHRAQIRIPTYTHDEQATDNIALHNRIHGLMRRRAAAHRSGAACWLAPTSPQLAELLLQAMDEKDTAARGELRERLEADLRGLSKAVITAPGSAERLVDFMDADRATDPVGARAFGCLLYRRDQPDGARFWWRFAAGVGDATAAYCLFLEALLRGELDEAVHCYRRFNAGGFLTDNPDGTTTDPEGRDATPEAALADVGRQVSEVDTTDGCVAVPDRYLADLPGEERADLLCHN
ncbi:hypothetical protein [Streptomyces sp. SBT349]|uniref:hypothetical protein n=1 Tax=Streptomyces sp. SBT349 TaxID=1580539 RepID=UPI00066CBA5C|nr:hypothetical protein [Streptomyces sp. SBT349]